MRIRIFFAVAVWVLLFIAILIFMDLPLLAVAGIWLVTVGFTLPFLLVVVPEVTGLVVLNLFTGKLNIFTQGIKLKLPWEQVKKENFFTLELVTKNHKETYAAKDGPMMIVKWSYQYLADQRRLDKFIAVDETTIDKGFADVISNILSAVIGGMEAEYSREHVDKVKDKVLESLEQMLVKANGKQVAMKEKLEEQYGVNFKLIAIADIDFSEDYQQARSGQARAAVFVKATDSVKMGIEGISGKEAANIVLLEQGKSTKKNIFELEGLTDALGTIIKTLKGG